VFTVALGLWHLVDSFLPRVENPWPDTIGLTFPFTLSAACGALVALFGPEAPRLRRDRAIRLGGLIGFCLGVLLYVVSLVGSIVSSL
jgi:peptidoglycan/LPS O-acetylase OafA/YrhL